MKQKALSIISVISVIGLIICLFEISSLHDEIDNLNRTISNQYEKFSRDVSSIYSNVDEKLKTQASILSEKSLEYGEKDLENRTVELIFKAVPKEYTPGKTTAFLVLDGKEYKMKEKNGSFSVKASVSLFDEHTVNRIVFDTEGVRQTEDVSEGRTPRWDVFPSVYATKSGQSSNRKNTFTTSGDCTISMESKGKITGIERVYLVQYLDGEEQGREEIPKDGDDNRTTFRFELNKGFELPTGSTLTLCTETVDSEGYIYRNIIEKVRATGSTSLDYSDLLWHAAEASIYSPEGELLWEDEIMNAAKIFN
ncbi:MAG: hypothetical protein IKA56_05115 [Clostridia bacterium]|nr:hypothetical protein [Clostridia bacterium]